MNRGTNLKAILLNNKFRIGIISFIVLCYMELPLLHAISPLHHVDGVPLLHRIMQLNQGVEPFGHFLFFRHGNSMHTIVYAIGLLDSVFFHNIPVLQTLLTFGGLILASIIVVAVLYDEKLGLLRNAILSVATCILIGGFSDQLYLPFQIGLSFTRPLFMLVIVATLSYFQKEKSRFFYVFLVFSACIVSALHGIGIMFAGTFVFLHIIYKQRIKNIICSFIPAITTVILHLTYNNGFGEVSSVSEPYLIKHFASFIKSIVSYFATPFGTVNINQHILVVLGSIVFLFVFLKLLWAFIVGCGLNKKIKFLPKLYLNYEINYSFTEGFMMAMLGMSFLSAISAAMFATARIEVIPGIGENPAGYTLSSTRYICYAVMPYIYLVWLVLKKSNNLSKMIKIAVNIACFITIGIFILQANFVKQLTINVNRSLDLSATGLLTGLPADSTLTNIIYPGYQNDRYWKDQIPLLLEYFKQNSDYIWNDVPRIGSAIPDDRKKITLSDTTSIDYELTDYKLFTAAAIRYPDSRYAAVLDINNTVVGYVYVERDRGLFQSVNDNKFYYDNKMYLKGFILNSASASEKFYLLID